MVGKEQLMPETSHEQFGVKRNLDLCTTSEFQRDFSAETDLIVASSPDTRYNLCFPFTHSERPAIGLEAMWIEFYGDKMKPIHTSVLKAAKAGFAVELHRDWYSDTILDQGFLFLPPTQLAGKKTKAHRQWVYGFTKKRLDMLEDAGAKIVPTNVPESLVEKATYLLRGRNHKKIIFIKGSDRMVAWVGGMNLAQEHFRQVDFMVKFDDPRIVQPLIDEFRLVGENKRIRNGEITATDDTTILIDTGKEESLILKRVLKDIHEAQETIYASSAFLPSGEILKALEQAKERGIHVSWITSNPALTKGLLALYGKISDLRSGRKSKIPVMSPENTLVHAKALIVDGKIAYFGSHNFIDIPHEELSLRSTNPTVVKNITAFLRNISKGNLDRELNFDFVIPDSQSA